MATEHTGLDAEELELERELASLLDVETFEPSAAFRANGLQSPSLQRGQSSHPEFPPTVQ